MEEIPLEMLNKQFLRLCYVEYCGILIYTVERDQQYEIMAIKVDGGNILWRLCGPVDGCVIQPKSITCDEDGNANVTDRATSRIFKIDILTGEILNLLLLEGEQLIYSIRWSNTEPNITLSQKNQVITYSIPK